MIPVFNEALTIQSVLAKVRVFHDGPIVVVDDGSTDGTTSLLAHEARIDLVCHEQNQGYGRTLMDGLKHARALGVPFAVTLDADGQHAPSEIPRFLEMLAKGPDVVSGSRFLPESRVHGIQPAERFQVNLAVLAEINRVTGWGITDAFCGFKGYRLAAIAELRSTEPGYAMPVEFWAWAWRARLKIAEISIDRIYFDVLREFPPALRDRDVRLAYYLSIWLRSVHGA